MEFDIDKYSFQNIWNNSFNDSDELLAETTDLNSSLLNSTSFTLPDHIIWDYPLFRITLILLYSIVFFTCIGGNLAVILVVTFQRRMRSITNFCLANLAFADFCVGIFCVYQNLYFILGKNWVLGNFVCKMYHFVHELSHTASVLILVVICVERYLVIIHPLSSKHWMTLNRLRFTIASVWIASGIYSTPKLFYTEARKHDYPTNELLENICTPNLKKFNAKIFDLINMGILFLLPLLILTLLYSIIGFVLWKSTSCDFFSTNQIQNTGNENNDFLDIDDNENDDTINRVRRRNYKEQLSCINILCCCHKSQNVPGSNRQSILEIKLVEIPIHTFSHNSLPNPTVRTQIVPATSTTTFTKSPIHKQLGIPSSASNTKPKIKKESKRFNQQVLRTRKKVLKMLVIMILSFAICNFPYHARKLWQLYGKDYNGSNTFSKIFTAISFLLIYAGSSINPFIYGLFSQSFRQCFYDIIQCKTSRRRRTYCSSPPDPPTIKIN